MNYIVTQAELQTLAALLGARYVFGFGEAMPLTRETAVGCVLSLTERGILTPRAEGFFLLPEVRALGEIVAFAGRCALITRTDGSLPQLCCYCRGGDFALVEPILQRQGEYRLAGRSAAALEQDLREDGYLPEPAGALAEQPPEAELAFLDEPQSSLLHHSGELRLVADVFDGAGQRQTARAAIVEWGGGLVLATAAEGRREAASYGPERFLQWLSGQMRGGCDCDFG